MSGTVPLIVSPAGLQPQQPSSILAQLLAAVSATNPGYTANLPGTLIEDIASTDVAAIALCDAALVELVNCLTPFGANAFILAQLGQIYGVMQGVGTNTAVYVVFTGSSGFPIPIGFTVSDGNHQYVVRDGGIIPGTGTGSTTPLYCVAINSGSWAVPPGTVNQIVTSVPGTITLAVTNPLAGTPSAAPQTTDQYRSQVLQAGLVAAQGFPRYLKTVLGNVAGTVPNLISAIQLSGKWEIIVGGTADPHEIAYAIFRSVGDISSLVGSTMVVTAITLANPGVVTTELNHGYATGDIVEINGATGMTAINGVPLTVTVITEKTFSIGVNTSGYSAYTGSGVLTPNNRNIVETIYDYPNTYAIPFVIPPVQPVAITLVWNTTSTNVVSASNMATLGSAALIAYVNGIAVGQPMNLFELQNAFQIATASILPTQLLTRMVFTVSINGVVTAPSSGTGIIAGDPESYFSTNSTLISITQG